MIDEHFEELAALQALGLLEGAELQEFSARLASEPALAQLLAAYEYDAAALAEVVPPRLPSRELRTRVLHAIGGSPSNIVEFPFWKVAVPWALAASLALMAAVLVHDRQGLRHEVATLEARDSFAQIKIATLSGLVDNYAKGTAVVLWEPKHQTGVIRVANMPEPRVDQDYQLWVIDPAYKLPVSAGVFHPEAGLSRTTFKPVQPIAQAQKFAISLEKKGGVEHNEGPIVMLGE